MNTTRKYLTLAICVATLAAAGCKRDAPQNTSVAIAGDELPDNTSPAQASGTEEAPAFTAAVQEVDIMPDEFARDGASGPARMALASLQPTEGNTASGLVAFILTNVDDDEVRVVGRIVGIPAGTHGMHIHETGNCTAPDASTAGQHFNPAGTMHGDREAAMRHVGDLGNITASADATADFDFADRQLTFTGMNSIVGKAVIIHASADDQFSQPSGNSGSPIACGVISNKPAVFVPE